MKTVVIYSGGLDSTVLLYKLRDEGHEVRPILFNYGQRHNKELASARVICGMANVGFAQVDLPQYGGSSQTDDKIPVPHGRYDAENMKATVVPGRNMIFIANAVAYAQTIGAHTIAYGAHAGDHAIYPDCRPTFIRAITHAALQGYNVDVVVPLLAMTKAEIVKLGAKLNVPFKLTWSCYEGKEKHCGRCGTCVERAEAFAIAGVKDPTEYMDPNYWRAYVNPNRTLKSN